jgi:hypothetical protein
MRIAATYSDASPRSSRSTSTVIVYLVPAVTAAVADADGWYSGVVPGE